MFVKLVQHFHGLGVSLELHNDGNALFVSLIAQVADIGDNTFVNQFANALDEQRLVYLEGYFGDVDALPV